MGYLKFIPIFFLLFFAGFVNAESPDSDSHAEDSHSGQSHFGHKEGGFWEIKDKLNLTDEQKSQVQEIRKASNPWEKQKDVWAEKDKLHDLIKKQDSSEAKIFAEAEKINRMQSEANLAKVKNILAFKKVLTPAQFTILSDFMEKKREEMKSKFRGRDDSN
jgi:Spy/CpxP family protein refolding chaperone